MILERRLVTVVVGVVGVGESLKESDLLTRQTTRATLCEFEVKTSKMTVFEQKKIIIEGVSDIVNFRMF